tara:strand:+ start:1954 stop:2376 length:423 start_codon:yes stop_codon:yes gene_type:complete
MRIYRIVAFITFAALLGNAVSAKAQQPDTSSEENNVAYEASIRCSAYHVYMAAVLEEEGEKEAAYFKERGVKWLALSYVRDGEDGKRADRELEPLLEKLDQRVEKFESEVEIEKFLTGINMRCETYEKYVQTEFDAIEIE